MKNIRKKSKLLQNNSERFWRQRFIVTSSVSTVRSNSSIRHKFLRCSSVPLFFLWQNAGECEDVPNSRLPSLTRTGPRQSFTFKCRDRNHGHYVKSLE